MVPEDRKAQGLLIDLPIADNVELADLAANGGFWLRPRQMQRSVRRLQDELRIKAPRLWQSASSLSGGNQQKVVIAKWLAIDPDLLILDEPTRGIDIGTKFELYKLIDGFAERGKGRPARLVRPSGTSRAGRSHPRHAQWRHRGGAQA